MTGADIAEFVAARLDEDEARERRLLEMLAKAGPGACVAVCFDDGTSSNAVDWNPWDVIGDYDPARALRDIAAKRAIMDEIFAYEASIDSERGCCCSASKIRNGKCRSSPLDQIDGLRHVASIWNDHPDYRPEWKP